MKVIKVFHKLNMKGLIPVTKTPTKKRKKRAPPHWQASPLHNSYNGFMLGIFLTLMPFNFAAHQFQNLLQRVKDFLDEVDIRISLPENRRRFLANRAAIYTKLMYATRRRSTRLGFFTYLGGMCVHLIAYGQDAPRQETLALLQALRGHLGRTRFGQEAVNDFETAMAEAQTKTLMEINDIISPSLALLAKIISICPEEKTTCFVAMPFSNPYLKYYSQLYRPLIQNNGLLAVRAWGDLATEVYYEVLHQLIFKCGVLLADVSLPNPNVFYEIGVAEGKGKRTILVSRKSSKYFASNFRDLVILPYSPYGSNWPVVDLLRMSTLISIMNIDLRHAEDFLNRFKSNESRRNRR